MYTPDGSKAINELSTSKNRLKKLSEHTFNGKIDMDGMKSKRERERERCFCCVRVIPVDIYDDGWLG